MEGTLLEAVRCSDAQEVARILAAGADPNEPDELGETPIFEATAVGHANIVALLLMSRADPDYRSPQGMVARQMALEPAALLLDLCSGRRSDAASWDEGLAHLSGPLRAPFARQFQKTGEEPNADGEDQDPFVQHENLPGSPGSPESPGPAVFEDGKQEEVDGSSFDPKMEDSPKSQQPGLEPLEPVNEGATVPAAERDVERQEVDSRQLDNELLESPADPSAAAQKIQEAKDEAPEDEFPANGTDVDVGTPHVVLHSPMIAVRREPCTRSVVLRYMRPGEKIALAEWDATHQWRRAFGEDAWVPVRHPTLGTLARPEGSGKDQMNGTHGKGGDMNASVQEVWRQLYEGGILNIPPPNGHNASSVASQALVEAATTGRAQTIQGEKALASLDVATVEYVMTAALQHLQVQN